MCVSWRAARWLRIGQLTGPHADLGAISVNVAFFCPTQVGEGSEEESHDWWRRDDSLIVLSALFAVTHITLIMPIGGKIG